MKWKRLHYLVIFIFALFFRYVLLAGFHFASIEFNLRNLFTDAPFDAFFLGDAWAYHSLAKYIVSAKSFGIPFHPPLVPGMLAGLYLLGGISFFNAHILFLLIGAVIPVVYGKLAEKWTNSTVGLIVAWCLALSFGQMQLSAAVSAEAPAMLFLGAGLLLITSQQQWRVGAGGALLGLAALSRVELLLFYALLFAAQYILKSTSPRKRLTWAVTLFLVVFSWSVRNWVFFYRNIPNLPVSAQLFPITMNGPFNFYIGNGPEASGSFRVLTSGDNPNAETHILDVNDARQRKIILNGYQMGIEYILDHKQRWIPMAWRKVGFFFRGFSTGFFPGNLPFGFRGMQRKGDITIPERHWMGFFLSFLAIPGFFILLKKNHQAAGIILLFLFAGLINTIVFFGLARQGIMQTPFLFLLDGVTLYAILKAISNKLPFLPRYRALVQNIAVCFFFLAIAFQTYLGVHRIQHPIRIPSANFFWQDANRIFKRNPGNRNALLKAYEKSLSEIQKSKEIVIIEEEFSRFLSRLAYLIDGSDPPRVERILERAIALDCSNAEAWKLNGIRFASKPEHRKEAIESFIRYLEIAPHAKDAMQIGRFVYELEHRK